MLLLSQKLKCANLDSGLALLETLMRHIIEQDREYILVERNEEVDAALRSAGLSEEDINYYSDGTDTIDLIPFWVAVEEKFKVDIIKGIDRRPHVLKDGKCPCCGRLMVTTDNASASQVLFDVIRKTLLGLDADCSLPDDIESITITKDGRVSVQRKVSSYGDLTTSVSTSFAI